MRPSNWPVVAFADILERVDRKIGVDDTQMYECVGVRWYGLGTFIRESKLGLDIRRKQQWIIREGDVVYNKLFAWKGAFAVADAHVDGRIVSDKFPTYRLDEDQVDSQYLRYYFRAELIAQQAQDLSKGAAAISKLTLNPPDFWKLAIPLPPLEEQHRIVARIDQLAALIEEAQELRAKAREEAQKIMPGALAEVFGTAEKQGWERRTVDEVLSFRDNGIWGPRGEDDGGGTFILRSTNFTNAGRISFENVAYLLVYNKKAEQKRLAPGDILLERSGGSEKQAVGRVAFFDSADGDYCFGNFVTRLRAELSLAYPDFLFRMLWGLHAMGKTASLQKRTTGIRNLRFREYLHLDIPVPPLKEQQAIVTFLDALETKVEELIRLQKDTQRGLDAMIPSILGKAFRGEL